MSTDMRAWMQMQGVTITALHMCITGLIWEMRILAPQATTRPKDPRPETDKHRHQKARQGKAAQHSIAVGLVRSFDLINRNESPRPTTRLLKVRGRHVTAVVKLWSLPHSLKASHVKNYKSKQGTATNEG